MEVALSEEDAEGLLNARSDRSSRRRCHSPTKGRLLAVGSRVARFGARRRRAFASVSALLRRDAAGSSRWYTRCALAAVVVVGQTQRALPVRQRRGPDSHPSRRPNHPRHAAQSRRHDAQGVRPKLQPGIVQEAHAKFLEPSGLFGEPPHAFLRHAGRIGLARLPGRGINLPRNSLLIYSHRDETSRVISAIAHVAKKVCHERGFDGVCNLKERELIDLIKSGRDEIHNSRVLTCAVYDAIEGLHRTCSSWITDNPRR